MFSHKIITRDRARDEVVGKGKKNPFLYFILSYFPSRNPFFFSKMTFSTTIDPHHFSPSGDTFISLLEK